MRQCLIAILMAPALAFATAGCSPGCISHVKVPRVHEPVRDFHDSDNIRKHAPNGNPVCAPDENQADTCYDDPDSYDCRGPGNDRAKRRAAGPVTWHFGARDGSGAVSGYAVKRTCH